MANILIIINMYYSKCSRECAFGDEVTFFFIQNLCVRSFFHIKITALERSSIIKR